MMLETVSINVRKSSAPGASLSIPIILKQFLEIDESLMIGGRFLFESMELAAEDGQILCIYEGILRKYNSGYLLRMIVVNKIHTENWFEFRLFVSPAKNSIRRLDFTRLKTQVEK